MNKNFALLVCSLFVLANNWVNGAHLFPLPAAALQRDVEDDYGLRNFESLLELARDESAIVEDSEAANFLRRLAHLSHLSKRAEGAAAGSGANDVNNSDLRRRSGGSGQNLNALWKTRVQRSDTRTPELSALWKTRV